jgi:TonB family protein
MRSRFLHCLLASVLFHVVVLGFPFSVTTGNLGRRAPLPVRVHLLTGDETVGGSKSKESEESMRKTAMAPVGHDSTRSMLSPKGPATTKQSQTEAHASRVKKKNTAAKQPTRFALEEATTNQKVSAVSQDSLSRQKPNVKPTKRPHRTTAASERSPGPTKQAILRTTTVYAASVAALSSANGARVETGVRSAPTGAQRATVPTTRGGLQPSQPGSFSRVRYARVVKPEYPEQARAQGWEGTTVLKVLVNLAGKSEQVRVQRTSGFNALDDAAVNAMQQWEFHPARYGREAVPSWVSVPIVFKLKEEN